MVIDSIKFALFDAPRSAMLSRPMGHDLNGKCLDCGKQSSHRCCYGEGGYCQLCGAEPREEDAAVSGPGEGEDKDEDEDELLGKDEDEMRVDKKDGVRRCVHCH